MSVGMSTGRNGDSELLESVGRHPFPASGIFRTRRYTLENYLLDPDCWFSLIQPFTPRRPKPGWTTVQEVQLTLQGLYRECLSLSAYNWTLRQARRADEAAFRKLPKATQSYRPHPNSLTDSQSVLVNLSKTQAQMGVTQDLGQVYTARLAELQTFSDDQLTVVVSGKSVHKLLSERFPLRLSGRDAWDDVVGAYLDRCPDPPADLIEIIERILSQAQA